MSYSHNTHISQSRLGEWRVDPDNRQDRRNGPVIEYKLSPEELKKYENIKGDEKKPIVLDVKAMVERREAKKNIELKGEIDMQERKIDKERLIELCKEYGFGKNAYEKIAEMIGVTWHTVECYVSKWGIRKLIEQEAAATIKQAVQGERKRENAKTKFYISTGYDNKSKAAKLAEVIESAGGEISYKWWELPYTEDIAELAQRGEAELQGVKDADVVVVMLPGRFGTHTEFGAALALGKRILLYDAGGFGVMPFYHVNGVRQVVGSDMDLVCEVLKLRSES